MAVSALVVLDELDDLDTLLAEAVRRAGGGADGRVFRRIDAQARQLRALVPEALHRLVDEAADAGKRVMDAADPTAPKLMLEVAQRNLLAALRRHVRETELRRAA